MKWRFIDSGVNDGYTNLATDEAILITHKKCGLLPTLRVYSWSRPTLLIGRSQKEDGINFKRCLDERIDVTRRISGGKAILFSKNDFGFSLVVSPSQGFPTKLDSFLKVVAKALITSFEIIGIETYSTPTFDKRYQWPVCLLFNSLGDVYQGGKKIASNAVHLKGSAFLNQGLVVKDANEYLFELLKFPDQDSKKKALKEYRKKIIGIDSIRQGLGYEDLKNAFLLGFQKAWNIDFLSGQLTGKELNLAQELVQKYKNPLWIKDKRLE